MTTLALLLLLATDKETADPWAFEGASASVNAKGVTRDSLSTLALEKLGLKLEAPLSLKASAKANTVGGVTLRLEDPSDAKAYCDLYAKRTDDGALSFSDSRCSFTAFSGQLRTTATCRKISGTARRLEDGKIALEARSPDCSAQPMGVPLSISGSLSPR
ncbi:MAG: hypothetical protein Q8N23_04985 [Archangium sp.]|nr:hypothetical protein [Archangium sp.]MDP3571413.1 hypothetical protein [Archangium sp.]